MRIELHPETEAEKAANPDLRRFEGVNRFFLAGMRDAEKPEFGHIEGAWMHVKGDVARISIELDAMLAEQIAFNGAIKAHNAIVQQAQAEQLGRNLRNGKIIH